MVRRILFLTLLVAPSCGGATTTYVGTVDGTDVAVGLVTDGSHVALFFCGGPSSFATSTKWFRFPASGDTFDASAGAWSAHATLAGATASGTVDRGDGKLLAWTAARVDDGSPDGLYESAAASGTAGVIVRSATDVSASQGAFIDAQQKIEQIVPIFPIDLEPQGLHVQIAGVDAFVPRASPD